MCSEQVIKSAFTNKGGVSVTNISEMHLNNLRIIRNTWANILVIL